MSDNLKITLWRAITVPMSRLAALSGANDIGPPVRHDLARSPRRRPASQPMHDDDDDDDDDPDDVVDEKDHNSYGDEDNTGASYYFTIRQEKVYENELLAAGNGTMTAVRKLTHT